MRLIKAMCAVPHMQLVNVQDVSWLSRAIVKRKELAAYVIVQHSSLESRRAVVPPCLLALEAKTVIIDIVHLSQDPCSSMALYLYPTGAAIKAL